MFRTKSIITVLVLLLTVSAVATAEKPGFTSLSAGIGMFKASYTDVNLGFVPFDLYHKGGFGSFEAIVAFSSATLYLQESRVYGLYIPVTFDLTEFGPFEMAVGFINQNNMQHILDGEESYTTFVSTHTIGPLLALRSSFGANDSLNVINMGFGIGVGTAEGYRKNIVGDVYIRDYLQFYFGKKIGIGVSALISQAVPDAGPRRKSFPVRIILSVGPCFRW